MSPMEVYRSYGFLHQKSYLDSFLGGGRKEDEDQKNGEEERTGEREGGEEEREKERERGEEEREKLT